MRILQEKFCKSHSLAFFLLAVYGFLVYGNTFGLPIIDVYHEGVVAQMFVVLGFVTLVFVFDKFFGILLLLSLIPCMFGFLQYSLLEFLICPYVFIFSVIIAIIAIYSHGIYWLKYLLCRF